MYTVYFACSRCSFRRLLAIRRAPEAANDDFRRLSRLSRPRCPDCGDSGVDIELRDPYKQIIARG